MLNPDDFGSIVECDYLHQQFGLKQLPLAGVHRGV